MSYRVEKWKEVYLPNGAMLRYVLEGEGYSVFQWCDRPGTLYPRHFHPEDQSHWVISGTLELTVDKFGSVLLEPGDRDLMPAGTFHSAKVIGDEPVVYLIGEKRD